MLMATAASHLKVLSEEPRLKGMNTRLRVFLWACLVFGCATLAYLLADGEDLGEAALIPLIAPFLLVFLLVDVYQLLRGRGRGAS